MTGDPHAPPKSPVANAALPGGAFIAAGRGVAAGNGWRWIAAAWDFMAPQRWTFVGVSLLLVVVLIAVQLVPLIGLFASTVLTPLVAGGFILGCDAVRRGGQLEVGHLFLGLRRSGGKLAAIGAVYLGCLVVIAIVMVALLGASLTAMLLGLSAPSLAELGGMGSMILLALLIGLAITLPICMALWFAVPLVVLADFDVSAALKTSFFACLKNVVPFLVWSVIVLLLAILATMPLWVGWLLLIPVIMVSMYTGYRDVFHET